MGSVSESEMVPCILCKSNPILVDSPKSSNVDKKPEKILLELVHLWNVDDLSIKEINLVVEFFSKNEESSNFCQICHDRIQEYDILVQKIRIRVSEFVKLLKEFLEHFESSDQRKREPNLLTSTRSSKRKRKKPKASFQSESEDEEILVENKSEPFVEKGTCLINLNPETYQQLTCQDSRPEERTEALNSILKDVFPKCALNFQNFESVCKFKSCGLKIRISLNEDAQSGNQLMFLSLNGEPQHSENEDPERRIFEMSKSDFVDEHICEFCCKAFSSVQDFSQHLEQQQEFEYTCPKCDLKFKHFKIRNSHFLNQHTTDSPYKCAKCSKCFKISSKCVDHQKVCYDQTRFPCNICQKSFSSVRNLDNHVQVVHLKTDSKWSFECPHCSKRFYKSNNLKSHLLTHDKEKKLSCSVAGCDQRFKRQKALDVHLAKIHGDSKESHLCSFCGKNFASLSGIKLHLAKHTGKEYIKKSWVCSVCGKAFRCRVDLETHTVVHTKEKPHTCNICSTSFTQKSSLKDHLNVHWNTYQCPKCKKSFGRQRYLEQHEKCCGLDEEEDERLEEELVDDPGLVQGLGNQTLILTKQDDGTSLITTQEVQCVIIGEAEDGESSSISLEPQKIHLIPSGDGTYVVRSDGGLEGDEVVTGANVLAHFNESGNIAMLEYTDHTQS